MEFKSNFANIKTKYEYFTKHMIRNIKQRPQYYTELALSSYNT